MNARAASAGGAKTSTAKKDRTNDMGLVTPASVDRGLPLNLEKRPPTNLVQYRSGRWHNITPALTASFKLLQSDGVCA